ncbi:MAG TPA: hypothetical protein VFX59_30305, partial [Polyangiales bacterium]|nr:hypothetical protein [Polyangiales bacterium]
TNVFRSSDPTRFDWAPITDIRAHAAEVIFSSKTGFWISSAGWTSNVGEVNRGLSLAELRWAEEE